MPPHLCCAAVFSTVYMTQSYRPPFARLLLGFIWSWPTGFNKELHRRDSHMREMHQHQPNGMQLYFEPPAISASSLRAAPPRAVVEPRRDPGMRNRGEILLSQEGMQLSKQHYALHATAATRLSRSRPKLLTDAVGEKNAIPSSIALVSSSHFPGANRSQPTVPPSCQNFMLLFRLHFLALIHSSLFRAGCLGAVRCID